jgi:hypothetical protein
LKSLGDVGPRRACVDAKHGNEADRSRAELKKALPNFIIGHYLRSSIEQNSQTQPILDVARVYGECHFIATTG